MAADVACCETQFFLYVVAIIGLVCFAGLMAGLTLGLMSLGLVDLEVLIKSGRPQDRKYAAKIFPVVKNQHLLLCTLLIGNAMAMESLPIFLDKLVAPWAAILISVTLILMFGEILPQAVCTRYGMKVGATTAPIVRVLLFLFFPIAYPISKMLDWMLGKGHAVLLRRAELKTFVDFHGNEAGKGGDLSHDETTIIAGALEMTEKTAKDAMTPISSAFSIDLDATLDLQTLTSIMTNGHSRVPVYAGNPKNIIGLILVKNLLTVDPNDAVPLKKMTIRKIPRVSETMPLYDILNEFQKGHSHIAVVIRDLSETKETKKTKEVKYIETKLHGKKHRDLSDTTSLKEGLNPHAGTQHPGVKAEYRDSQAATTGKDGDQQSKSRLLGASGSKKQHRGCSFCILDVLDAPIPEFPPNEEVVGVITMEDVIEELLQEEILDETDEYINIHNRIKVNMQASQGKVPQLNSSGPSPILSSTACTPTPMSPPMSMGHTFNYQSPVSPHLIAPGPTPTLSISTGTSVPDSPVVIHLQDSARDWQREAVALLGLCFIFIWSTFSTSSSSLTFQRDSFSDIAEPAVANEKGIDSGIQPKKSKISKHDVPKQEKVKSDLGGKDKKKKEKVPVSHHKGKEKNKEKVENQKGEEIELKERDSVASNSTITLEKLEDENSEKEKDGEDEIEDKEEAVDSYGETNGETEGDVDLEEQEPEENMEDENVESKNSGKKKKKLGPLFDSKIQYTWKMCSVRSKYNYIPCLDVESTTGKLQIYRHHERSCPKTPPMCLVPLPPEGYKTPVPWPQSKLKIFYGNVEHPKLAAFIKTRTWLMQSEEYLTFPQSQSEFRGGVLHYLEFIEEMVPDIEWGKNIRIVLDIGCTDSSFGAALLDKEVLALSLGLKDDLTDLAQVALERGFPTVVSPFGTRRLPFPSGVFDAIHCGECSIPWHSNGGRLLLEMNRILRPGGYFILSKKHDTIEEEEEMLALTASICWNILAHKTDEISDVGVKIYQKPDSNDIYELRRKKHPPLCKEDEKPDAAWYVPMKTCLHTIPASIEQRGTEWPEEWPKRLQTFPEWLGNTGNLVADTEHWKAIVDKSYLIGMGINWSNVRNIMDMKAIYGGFAAALAPQKVWVMNVVPVHAPDTLPVIYERGLLGIYHDWCESFGSYPRTYDLLHADHLFSRLKNRCKQPVGIVVEMDRLLRPGGWLIIRDKLEILDPLEVILRSLHWEMRMTYAKDKEGIICAQKTTWRP
ncbi:CBS domain [Macleaya cordata]|uniref:CBS domain n=1 Tax=Macleaya cordata TaxID=56857 RepID=A0A200Q9A2_MACCD|nr:CBS domain [Macleaya cordata]